MTLKGSLISVDRWDQPRNDSVLKRKKKKSHIAWSVYAWGRTLTGLKQACGFKNVKKKNGMRNKKFCALSPTVYYTINFPPIKKKKKKEITVISKLRHVISKWEMTVSMCVCVWLAHPTRQNPFAPKLFHLNTHKINTKMCAYLHIISWVRRTLHISGFLSWPS